MRELIIVNVVETKSNSATTHIYPHYGFSPLEVWKKVCDWIHFYEKDGLSYIGMSSKPTPENSVSFLQEDSAKIYKDHIDKIFKALNADGDSHYELALSRLELECESEIFLGECSEVRFL